MTTATLEQKNSTLVSDRKIDIGLTLTPLIGVSFDAGDDASPSALAAYAQYASTYLGKVEQFVARNNVSGLKASGPVELEATDECYRVDMSAVLTFATGSAIDKGLQAFESVCAGGDDEFLRNNAERRFESQLAAHIRQTMSGYGYLFNVEADYQGEVIPSKDS